MKSYADHGIELPAHRGGEIRTFCPQCREHHKGRSKTLSVNTDKAAWCCFRCGWKGGLQGGELQGPGAPPRPDEIPDISAQRRERLRKTWAQSRPVEAGDPVDRYLRSRGLALEGCPAVLRHHPALPYHDDDGYPLGGFPAMLARVDDPKGQGVCIHRTYLTPDGRKAPVPTVKKLMSPAVPGSLAGAAIRLIEPLDTLLIAEGIETALAGYVETRIPAWSAICANGLEAVILPLGVRLIYIMADRDPNGRGEKAAKVLARRLLLQDRDARIVLPEGPPDVAIDWANVHLEQMRARDLS